MLQRKLKDDEYLVPVTFEMSGFVPVRADSAEEAWKKVMNDDGTCPLPDDKEYVEGSLELSFPEDEGPEMIEEYTNAYNSGQLNITLEQDGWEGPDEGMEEQDTADDGTD